jgi:copper transport protein
VIATETALRAGSYAGLVLLAGVAAFWLYIWPEGRRNRVIMRLAWTGWWVSVACAGLLLVVETVRTKSGLLDVIATRTGTSLMLRLALAALAWSWLGELSTADGPRPAGRLRGRAGMLVLALLPLTWVSAGRSVTGHYAAAKTVLASLHIVAMTVWLGGLVVLVVILLPQDDPTALHGALPRFSPVAATSVAVLAGSGLLHAVAEADGITRLLHSGYGALLLAKLAAFSIMLLLGNEGRRYTGHRFETLIVAHRSRLQILCLAVGAEIAIGTIVLSLSAALTLAPL